jgi:hypothetical protein
VSGAGTPDVNGVYKKGSDTSDGEAVFTKDSTHDLYRWEGAWRLGKTGHGLTYVNTIANADGPPSSSGWQVGELGAAPLPTIACV